MGGRAHGSNCRAYGEWRGGEEEPETARVGAAAADPPAEEWRRRMPRREDADADRSLAVAMGSVVEVRGIS